MLSQFVAKFTVESQYCISRNGSLAIESFTELREAVIDLANREAAALFAEPIVTAKGDLIDVAYYGEPIGGAVPIDRLDAAARGVVIEKLKARLAVLAPLLSSRIGPLLSDALYVAGPEDVLAIGSEPLLLRWGMLPPDVRPGDQAALDAHFAATLGRYAPFGAPRLEQSRRIASSGSSRSAPAPAGLASAPAVGVKARGWPLEGRGLVIATGLAALVTLLLALPGFLAAPAASPIVDADRLPTARQISRAMQDKVDQARKALTKVVCNPDGSIKPGPNTGEPNQIPPAPIPVTPAAAGNSQGDMALVARRATDSVVLLMNCVDRQTWEAERQDKEKGSPVACPRAGASSGAEDLFLDSSGSGFFIAPKLVATNMHVVEGAKRMFASSTFLGRVVPGKVEAATVKVNSTDPDFAVVSFDIDASPPPIPISTSASLLQNVVAAGFPGIFMMEEQLERLLKGDARSMPELTTYPGFITQIKDHAAALRLIYSSATIGHGNSGGPLLDLCARAVGINTLGGSGHNDETSISINIAEDTGALGAFLDQHNIAHQTATDACSPAAQASNPPPPSPPPTGTPPPIGKAPAKPTPPAAATPDTTPGATPPATVPTPDTTPGGTPPATAPAR